MLPSLPVPGLRNLFEIWTLQRCYTKREGPMRTGSAGTVQFVQVRRIQQRQRLRLQQKPVLTQSVRQLAELLMLNRQELREAIREALESNPMLEIAVSSEAEGPAEVPESATADLPLGGDDSEEPAVGDSLGEIDLEAYFDEGMDPIPTEEAADAHGQRAAAASLPVQQPWPIH